MDNLENCHEFYSMSLPPAERMFQRKRRRFALLDDHVQAGVNFLSTTQEIVREWKQLGEDVMEFENDKRLLAEEKEKFNAEKKGLEWRLSDAEGKLAQEKKANAEKQKDWENACERTNVELRTQRETITRLSGEKKEIADEANKARMMFEKKEKEYVERIAKLEVLARQYETSERLLQEKTVECQAAELLAEETAADCKWLLSRAVPLLADRIVKSHELANYMYELGQAGYNSGRKDGYNEGRAAAANKEKEHHFELWKEDCTAAYAAKRQEFSSLEFAVVKGAKKLAQRSDGVAKLKNALGDDGGAAGGAGPSHPE